MPSPEIAPEENRQVCSSETDIGGSTEQRSLVVIHQDAQLTIGCETKDRVWSVTRDQ